MLRNIERYQRLHTINNIYKEMYSMVKRLLRLHNNQDIYDNVIDDMIKIVKDMKRRVNTTIHDMTTIIQEHADMFALKDMTRPITNTYNNTYTVAPIPTPRLL